MENTQRQNPFQGQQGVIGAPGQPGPQPQQININPLDYPEVVCDKCGCTVFTPGLKFRAIPGTVVGQAGQTVYADQRVVVCMNCHELSPMDKEVFAALEKAQETIKRGKTGEETK